MASVLLSIVVRKWLISKTGVSRDLISGNPGVLKKNAGNKQACESLYQLLLCKSHYHTRFPYGALLTNLYPFGLISHSHGVPSPGLHKALMYLLHSAEMYCLTI